MLINPHFLNVDPASRLVAEKALVNPRMGLPGDFRGDHVEMLHVVAWWSLMALGTI